MASDARAGGRHELVERRLGDVGVRYGLTPWGAGLREPIEAFVRWSAPLMMNGRSGGSFQPRWLAVALPALLRGVTAAPAIDLGFEVEGSLMVLHVDEDGPRVEVEPDRTPEAVLTAGAEVILGLAAGALTIDQALAAGHLRGDVQVLRSVLPPPGATAAAAS